MSKTPKRPRDLNQWAKLMVDIATGQLEEHETTLEEQGKRPVAVSPGSKGGKTRARQLTPEERKEMARKAANVRWGKGKVAPVD
jgi:hypothetical protein